MGTDPLVFEKEMLNGWHGKPPHRGLTNRLCGGKLIYGS